MEIWNNPSCSKCASARQTLELNQVPAKLRAYLDQPPSPTELEEVLSRLDAEPWDICRLGEPIAVELGMDAWPRDHAERGRWINTMSKHPQLIQRPILLLDDGGALVARTPEAIAEAIRRTGAAKQS